MKREQLVLNAVTSSKIVGNHAGQRVIVSVPSLKTNTPRSHSGLNLDGNISESSDSEDDSNHISKILSLSRVILRRNSGPKSTVEDSRCSPAVLKLPSSSIATILRMRRKTEGLLLERTLIPVEADVKPTQ